MAEDKFDPFSFIRNRASSMEPSPIELKTFDLFSTNRVLSMSRNTKVPDILSLTNTIPFGRMPKHVICKSFTSLDGMDLSGKWALPKKEVVSETKEYVEKVMMVLDCSMSSAKSMIESGHLDKSDIEKCYESIFDNSSPKKRKSR